MADEYIRRDAAMKAVASQYGACRSPAQNRLLDEIRNKIRRMPAADVAEVVQWISVKDAYRRAPAGQRVIATDGVFVGEAYRTSADSWRRYDDYRLWHDATGRTVTHWMPLPEVPEGEL